MSINPFNKIMTAKRIAVCFMGGLLFSACSKDNEHPKPINQEEVITTVRVVLTPGAESMPIELQSRDLDGDGPNAPVITVSDNLLVNTTYSGRIVLLNETMTPIEDITEEVAQEANDHQFFFSSTGPIGTIVYADEDGNGNPLGILFNLSTLTAGPGTLTVTLRHQPKKPNNGTLADAGGETDIAQTFNFTIQ